MTNEPGTQFFTSMRQSLPPRTSDRWVGGVCAGWAHRWGIDPLIVRGGLVVLTVIAGLGVVLYALGWMLMPESDGRIHLQEALAGRFDAAHIGAGGMLLIGLYNPGIWYIRGAGEWFFSSLATIVLVAIVVLVIRQGSGNRSPLFYPPTPPPPATQPLATQPPPSATPTAFEPPVAAGASPTQAASFHSESTHLMNSDEPYPTEQGPNYAPFHPTEAAGTAGPVPGSFEPVVTKEAPARTAAPSDPRATRIFLALSLLVVAGAIALRSTNWQPVDTASVNIELLMIGALLVVLGLGVLVAAFRRRSSGSIGVIGSLVLIFVAVPALGLSQVSANIGSWSWTSGSSYGDADWQPLTPDEAALGFSGVAIGEVNATLLPAVFDDIDESIDISLAIGELNVVLPADVPIVVEASTGIGSINVDYPRNSGSSDQTRGGIGTNFTVNSPAVADAPRGVEPVVVTVSNVVGEITITFED